MNEETIIEKKSAIIPQAEQNSPRWKYVVLGGVPGILMGAGLMAGGHATARTNQEEVNLEEQEPAVESQATTESQVAVANNVNDSLSFGEAFQAARAAVGPGGVFEWHGGLYNTYTAEEWNAMSAEQKADFAQQVNPITPAEHIQTPTDSNTHVVIVHDVPSPNGGTADVQEVANTQSDVQTVDPEVAASYQSLENENVHLVGFADADGHLVAGYDITGDGQADVAVIDVGQPGLSSDDVITDGQDYMRIGDLQDEPDPNQYASAENPDVAPDMPDYSNDVYVDA